MTTASLRTTIAVAGLLIIAGWLLASEHQTHGWRILPYLLILACPILHLFFHRGHGAHDGRQDDRAPNDAGDRAGAGDAREEPHHG